MTRDFSDIERQLRPPGSYSKAEFAQALAPLWKQLGFRSDRHEDVVRAGSIATKLYDSLGSVLRLDEIHDSAERLAEDVEEGDPFPGVMDSLSPDRRDAVEAYIRGTTRRPKWETLRRLGY